MMALLILTALVSCQPNSGSPRDAFKAFELALKAGDTKALDSIVDSGSKDYFRALQPWIIVGNEESLASLNPFDQYLVYLIRMHSDSLSESDWKDWLEQLQPDYSIDPLGDYLLGILEESFFRSSLGKVDSFAGVTAGPLYRHRVDTGIRLRFKREDSWKVDLKSFLQEQFEQEIKPYLSDRYKNRDRVWEMLQVEYGDRMNPEIRTSRVAR